MRRISLALGLSIAMLLTACEGWTGARQSEEEPARLISAERISAPEGVRAWDVEYRSTTVLGEPTVVTGWIAIPEVEGPIPLLAWAHPTAGLGDECAPSRAGGRRAENFLPELEAGWAVVATDYEGLGGPGLHPYLLGESEARSIFDIGRAARELDGRVSNQLVMWGFSQGGHAVMSAAALASELAPDFDIRGTAAVAPAIDLIGWPELALGTREQGYIVAIVAGYAAAYGLDLTEVLTDRAIGLLDEVETSCSDPTFYGVAGLPSTDVFTADPSTIEPWSRLLLDNSPEFSTIESPILLVLGDEDDLWRVDDLPIVLDRMCAAGSPVATSILIGEDHLSVNGAARGEIAVFLRDRLAGAPFTSEC